MVTLNFSVPSTPNFFQLLAHTFVLYYLLKMVLPRDNTYSKLKNKALDKVFIFWTYLVH